MHRFVIEGFDVAGLSEEGAADLREMVREHIGAKTPAFLRDEMLNTFAADNVEATVWYASTHIRLTATEHIGALLAR